MALVLYAIFVVAKAHSRRFLLFWLLFLVLKLVYNPHFRTWLKFLPYYGVHCECLGYTLDK